MLTNRSWVFDFLNQVTGEWVVYAHDIRTWKAEKD
jgi:hypothetical protein